VILVDTSAWVEFDRATGSRVHLALRRMIERAEPIAVTEPVLMEVLAGVRPGPRLDDVRRLLTSFAWIPLDPVCDFEGAASVYRTCRAAGITPRGLVDCLIATVAIRSGAALLAVDGDFERMATVLPVRLAPV
jgi:predicted nucleic acid-binding protein